MDKFHHKLIENFYSSFKNSDPEGMANCYHETIEFEDPAFGKLHGEDAKMMWKMLIERSGGKLVISYGNITADNIKGSAEWEARYVFVKTGRKVHNKIKATFIFEDGRIIKHADKFNFWKWSSMAFGITGILLGGTPILKSKVRIECLKLLSSYKQKAGKAN